MRVQRAGCPVRGTLLLYRIGKIYLSIINAINVTLLCIVCKYMLPTTPAMLNMNPCVSHQYVQFVDERLRSCSRQKHVYATWLAFEVLRASSPPDIFLGPLLMLLRLRDIALVLHHKQQQHTSTPSQCASAACHTLPCSHHCSWRPGIAGYSGGHQPNAPPSSLQQLFVGGRAALQQIV